jgi:aspartokinase
MIAILSTTNPNEAEITKQMLEENNINVVLLNKQDSSYNMFGIIELFVTEDQLEIAKSLLKKSENERNA